MVEIYYSFCLILFGYIFGPMIVKFFSTVIEDWNRIKYRNEKSQQSEYAEISKSVNFDLNRSNNIQSEDMEKIVVEYFESKNWYIRPFNGNISVKIPGKKPTELLMSQLILLYMAEISKFGIHKDPNAEKTADLLMGRFENIDDTKKTFGTIDDPLIGGSELEPPKPKKNYQLQKPGDTPKAITDAPVAQKYLENLGGYIVLNTGNGGWKVNGFPFSAQDVCALANKKIREGAK
jgi:hypothetical protein